MKDGRPLRFLAAAMVGWTAIRAAMLWPGAAPLVPLIHALAPPLVAAALTPSSDTRPPAEPPVPAIPVHGSPERTVLRPSSNPAPPIVSADAIAAPLPEHPAPPPRILAASLAPAPVAHGPGRLAGSAWLLARGGPSGTLSGGQLGASQAGLRITYALGHARRVALTARIAAPLRGAGKEAALGLEWKPTRLPIRLIAEQRFVLDGGRGGPTIGLVGGYGPADIATGVRLETYAQAGAIARDGVEGFVDAAGRLTHPTAHLGHARLDLGIGAWGSAQRGAARFDLGPTAGLAVPVAGRSIRMALDWRERLAGSARPGSGPAFTIGSDF